MQNFLDIIWILVVIHVLVVCLMLLYRCLTDLLRDQDRSGWSTAIWIIALILMPLVTALVYLITRRQPNAQGSESVAQNLASAKALRDSGAITQAEFDTMKAKMLAHH